MKYRILLVLVLPVALLVGSCGRGSVTGPTPEPACSFSVVAPAADLSAAGGDLAIAVATTSGCAWTATSNAAFISTVGGATGNGAGTARFLVQANSGAARTGSLVVAGSTLLVRQSARSDQACSVTVTPTALGMIRQGGNVIVSVDSEPTCAWTATSGSPFITVAAGGAGTGRGQVSLGVERNSGDLREGTVMIGGRTVTITQEADDAASCAFVVAADRISAPSAGQTTVVTITAPPGSACPWTVESRAGFISANASTGAGSGSVALTISRNAQAARSGVVVVAGKVVTVDQASADVCATAASPLALTLPAGGGSQSIQVTAPADCAWSAASSAAFASVSGDLFVGSQTVAVSALANTSGNVRSATVTVAGRTVTVQQPVPAPTGPKAVLSFISDPGDYIGQGQSATYTLLNTQFSSATDTGRTVMTFNMPFSGGPSWSLNLKAATSQSLQAGYYPVAARYPFQPAGIPGLSFSGSGRGCNQLTGRFLVAEAVYGPGNAVQRFHARFEQHCEGSSAALRGEIWIDSAGGDAPPLAPFPPSPGTPSTFLSFVSDPGDPIGQGQSRQYPFVGHTWSAWSSTAGRVVRVNMQPVSGPSYWWSLEFSAPQGQILQPGTYTGATRYPFQAPSVPGFSFSGSGRGCSTLTGSFSVLEVSLGPQGEVLRFHATFEQRCEGATPALRGEVRIVADPWR